MNAGLDNLSSLPVGAVIQYAGPIDYDAPGEGSASYPKPGLAAQRTALERAGWLICDGALVATARYPKLFRVIGWAYGMPPADEPGWFYLPDYRGRVLRGVNGTAPSAPGSSPPATLLDTDAAMRTAQNPGGWTGNAVGTVQDDALQVHVHPYTAPDEISMPSAEGEGACVGTRPLNTDPPIKAPAAGQPYAANLSQETRAKNVAVHMLIRAT